MSQEIVAALIQIIVTPKCHKIAREMLLELSSFVKQEADNIGYELHQLQTNPGAFYILGKWTNKKAMDAHLYEFGVWVSNLTKCLVAAPTISRARMLSPPKTSISPKFYENQITLVPFFYVKSDPRSIVRVKNAHLSVVASTRLEPGCLDYDLYQLLDDPAVMFFYENWASADALSRHMNTPNFYRVVRGQVDPLLLVPWTALDMKLISMPFSCII
jgi:quinol monooxygenase YgiN